MFGSFDGIQGSFDRIYSFYDRMFGSFDGIQGSFDRLYRHRHRFRHVQRPNPELMGPVYWNCLRHTATQTQTQTQT